MQKRVALQIKRRIIVIKLVGRKLAPT